MTKKNNKFLPYYEARLVVISLNIKSSTEWYKKKAYLKLNNIPSSPKQFYKNNGWVGWGHFLGSGIISTKLKSTLFPSYEEAQRFALRLNLKGMKDWRSFVKSGNLPKHMSSNPHKTYKENGWINWRDFLGTDNYSFTEKYEKFISYEDAKKYLTKFKLKNYTEFVLFFKNNKRPKYIPSSPHATYSKKGSWISWEDFLSLKKEIVMIESKKSFFDFDELKNIIQNNNIQTQQEYENFRKNWNYK